MAIFLTRWIRCSLTLVIMFSFFAFTETPNVLSQSSEEALTNVPGHT